MVLLSGTSRLSKAKDVSESTQEAACSAYQSQRSLWDTVKVLGTARIAGWPWLSVVALVSPIQATHLSPTLSLCFQSTLLALVFHPNPKRGSLIGK